MFKLPNLQQIKDIFINLLQAEIPELDPTIKQSFIGYLARSNSLVASQYIDLLKEAYNDNFVLTASRDALLKLGEELNVPLPLPQKASGIIVAEATESLQLIPSNSQFTIYNNIYINNSASVSLNREKTISVQPIYDSVDNSTTITVSEIHNLIMGFTITIEDIEYIVKNIIDEYTFTIDGDITEVATLGSILKLTTFEINVISKETGINQNVAGNTILSSSLVDGVIGVSYAGLNGGTDETKTEEYRKLLLAESSIKGGSLTEREINLLLLKNGLSYINFNIPVSQEGGDPDVGIVKMYVLRSNEQQASSFEKAKIKTLILNNLYPVNDDPANLFILDAIKVPINFEISNLEMNTVTGIVPASQTLRNAVIYSLQNFFIEEVGIGEIVERSRYTSAVERSVDEYGNTVASVEILLPENEITVQPSQKVILGSVSFV